ncbi:MAG: hypothetical protein ABR567_06515 [Myxococcales bacterium]|nr:hypothetical protein [Myxococcales bacterium]
MLAAAIALLGTACYSESAPNRYYVARDRAAVAPAEFDAYTTSGDFVRVAQDRRTGDLIIVSPSELHGARVAIVSDNGGNGAPLVTTDVRGRRVIIREGSAGDRP